MNLASKCVTSLLLQASRVMNVNERGGVSVRIPGRDSSLSSVSLWCCLFVF